MDEERLPKRMLFGELRKRDHVKERKKVERCCYIEYGILVWEIRGMTCAKTGDWFKLCCEGMESMKRVLETRQRNECPANNQSQSSSLQCTCGRSFRRQGDLTRHERFCGR